MINWNIWRIISLVLWSTFTLTYLFFIFTRKWYAIVWQISLIWKRTKCGLPVNNLFLVFNLEISWPRWLTKQYNFFLTNFSWKTSLDLSVGKNAFVWKNTWQYRLARMSIPTKTSFSLQPLATESLFRSKWCSSSPLPFVDVNQQGRREVSGHQQA